MPKETKFYKKTEKYIETGAFEGYSIQLALDSGFSEIYAIELFEQYYQHCKNRFSKNSKVHLFLGDSATELNKVLDQNPNEPFTFWLDAHTNDKTPLMTELEKILSRNINGELIYIDDMRLYNNFNDIVNIDNIIKTIEKYKPHAQISYEDDQWSKNDILIIDY
jgi:predicted O-methyltransferase YrrM